MEKKKERGSVFGEGLPREFPCSCGRTHRMGIEDIVIGKGVLRELPRLIQRYQGKRAFVLADRNTWSTARKVCDILEEKDISCAPYVYEASPEPDEAAVGSCIMHFDRTCDILVAVGSGVLNDICKILSSTSNRPYIIVATAPSMDGYASATASVAMDGLKVSLPAVCAKAIVGDTEILRAAPERMLLAGLGDMLAKYISICEWRISHVITGEYYCETIAAMVRAALKKCVDHAEGLLEREEEAVQAVMEGLIMGGVAMSYAGKSRPASGVEHYISHIWDMRGLACGAPVDFHGIQCAVGTLMAVRLYEKLAGMTPCRERALDWAEEFDYREWSRCLEMFLGKGAQPMIAAEDVEGKYDLARHRERLEVILEKWEEIRAIIHEEIPSSRKLEKLMANLGMPMTASELGMDAQTLPMTFRATKDIRDKYVLSRLAWDLGVLEDLAGELGEEGTAGEEGIPGQERFSAVKER